MCLMLIFWFGVVVYRHRHASQKIIDTLRECSGPQTYYEITEQTGLKQDRVVTTLIWLAKFGLVAWQWRAEHLSSPRAAFVLTDLGRATTKMPLFPLYDEITGAPLEDL